MITAKQYVDSPIKLHSNIYLLGKKVEDIDTTTKLGSNTLIGRFELADIIGLDVLLAGYENLYNEYKDPAYEPPFLLKRLVAAGWLGRKTGRGFYTYPKEEKTSS